MSNKNVEFCVNQCLARDADKPCAIISDIHANVFALEAVLEDIALQGVNRICCLGDVVGYGVFPIECWRMLKDRVKIVIRGNHDQALSSQGIARFHPRARKAIEWTVDHMRQEAEGEEAIATLSALPTFFTCRKSLYVHGSPAGVTMGYLLSRDSFDAERMKREFSKVRYWAFNGHTHIPGVIEKGKAFLLPEGLHDMTYQLGEKQAIINVGSVGQPRDGNPKSCYVIVENETVRYRRVGYDTEAACKAILAVPELDPFLGLRLLEGRQGITEAELGVR